MSWFRKSEPSGPRLTEAQRAELGVYRMLRAHGYMLDHIRTEDVADFIRVLRALWRMTDSQATKDELDYLEWSVFAGEIEIVLPPESRSNIEKMPDPDEEYDESGHDETPSTSTPNLKGI